MHTRPFPLKIFAVSQPNIFYFSQSQSFVCSTTSETWPCERNYRKAPLSDDEKRAIFEDAILMTRQALIPSEKKSSQICTHTFTQCQDPWERWILIKSGEGVTEGTCGAQDGTSESFNIKLWHFYEACFGNWKFQFTKNNLLLSHTQKQVSLAPPETSHTVSGLQTKHTDRCWITFSCTSLSAATYPPPVS